MLASIETFFRRWRRRLSRSEWAIRHLRLTPSDGTSEEPGLLLIQIDGFARSQLERALAKGEMPYLRRLLRREGYQLHSFYPGLPSTTPAVQAELYYGIRAAVPAFSFFDRTTQRLGMMYYPSWAKEFEARYQKQAEGLLKGGSCWSNIYTGGADQAESHFCGASIGLGDMWRTGKIRNIFVFILLEFPAALRIAALLIAECFIAFWDVLDGVRKGEKLGPEIALAFSRVFIGLGVRELVTIGGKVDVARGLPIVHLNFLGYDEQAHRRGPGSAFAFWSLRGIDRAIKNLARAARRSQRRDYAVWIFSDHGQERTRSFALEFPGGVERIIRDCLDAPTAEGEAQSARSQRQPEPPWFSRSHRAQRRLERQDSSGALSSTEKVTFTVAAVGPVGHVYFSQPMPANERLSLGRRLVSRGNIPGVLVRGEGGAITWLHASGETRVPDEVPALLPHPNEVRTELARDLAALCENSNAGDLVLLGWSPEQKPWTFAPERGAHGGPGPEETRGFVLLPAQTHLPGDTEAFIRPSALRAAALHQIGRVPLAEIKKEQKTEVRLLRLMTYNVHGCSGMDGRISPRRVARVVQAQLPDLVALQEVDLGRRRSRAEDQSALIAQSLGMNLVFCPTVTRNSEHYGHALLSRWPIEVVKRGILPADERSWWREPRAALWGRVRIGDQAINIITTHLGLSRRERRLQMEMLLGDGWIKSMPPEEPVILCGDFNLLPGSRPYRLALTRMRDAQKGDHGFRPLATFTSARPLMRLDHIFISTHLSTRAIFVPRNDLTRLASDHLPLVADLAFGREDDETPTTKKP